MVRQDQHYRRVRAAGLLATIFSGRSAAAAGAETNLRAGNPAATSRGLQTSALTSLGCFADSQEDRVLELGLRISTDMTPDFCAATCLGMDDTYSYFAVQYAQECWCGAAGVDYARLGGSVRCNRACTGDSTITCGGRDAFEIFQYAEEATPLGCWADRRGNRLFASPPTVSDSNTPEECQRTCIAAGGFEFFGVQYGRECFCGLATEDYTKLGASTRCTFACTGDDLLECGGFNAMEVFSIGGDAPETETPAPSDPAATSSPTTSLPAPTPTPTQPAVTSSPTTSLPAPTPTQPAVTSSPTTSLPAPTPAPTPPESTPSPIASIAGCKVVIVEGEDLPLVGDWNTYDDPLASGGKYVVWEGLAGDQANNQSPDDIITSTVQIPAAGTYRFRWKMRQPDLPLDKLDKANDSWLYFPTPPASRFGPANRTRNYGDWVKVFGRAPNGVFKYDGRAEEADGRKNLIAVEFPAAGEYEMWIAGRSHGHQIDQIVLYDESLDFGDIDDAIADGTAC